MVPAIRASPCTERRAEGEVVPRPNLLVELSHTKLSSYEIVFASVQKAALFRAPVPATPPRPVAERHVPLVAKHP